MQAILRRGLIAGTAGAIALAIVAPPGVSFATASHRTTLDPAPAWTKHASRVAAASDSTKLRLTAVLALRDAAGAEKTARDVSDPSSSSYRHFMTAAQWRAKYAPTNATVSHVKSWLADNGFTVTQVPSNHRFVSFTGSVASAEKAFGTTLDKLRKDGSTVVAPVSSVSVPSTVAGDVVAIGGLDGSEHAVPQRAGVEHKKALKTSKKVKPGETLPPPDAVFRNATPCSSYYGEKPASDVPQILDNPLTYAPCGYTPAQLRGAYGTDAALKQGYDGRGATVAVVDAYASPYIFKDASTYAKKNDPKHPLRSYQFAQSTAGNYTETEDCGAGGWYGEETLDVEAVHAMAPAANILYMGAKSCEDNDILAAVNSVVDNELAEIITNSYGNAGEPDSAADVAGEHQTYVQAAAQGISVLFSSGDSGDEIDNLGERAADYPASDPFVTAVGGTSLAVNEDKSYGFEQGWGTGKSTLVDGAWDPADPAYLYGGGGGTSAIFKQPNYQKKVVPSSIANYFGNGAHRAVPDIAMVGDPNTGFLVGQSQSFPDGSIKYDQYRIGGTSLSSPLLAGVMAVANQVNGGPLGFLNPTIYKLAGTSAFRDVNHGRAVTDGVVRVDFVNGYDDADGTVTSLRTLNQTGTIYTRAGYDDVTGVGSPHGVAFLNAITARKHR